MTRTTLPTEQAFLERIQMMPQIGICFRDPDNNVLMQFFVDDPALRDALVEYQTQRVRELELSTEKI
ncbi:hypothetical protein [Spirosoma oryzicola]|uniref:hypothetical protein n=1 Tax=Spirosoma oryzicola TaxID=2898794 RepID=UPI001E5C1F84|nr:hypothetical protein [Spirosoma oryzicola]UHG93411.1 hypothetical protein LQ777_11015 [Spirosoma oryzicola]